MLKLTILLFVLLTSGGLASGGDEGTNSSHSSGFGVLEKHDHEAIIVKSKPVVERIPINVIEPVDIRVTFDHKIMVADSRANAVFRIGANGEAELAATNMSGLVRLVVDGSGSTFALTQASASGEIHEITPSGYIARVFSVPFSPGGFSRDAIGNFLMVASNSRRIGILDANGIYQELDALPEPAVDVATNSADQFHVLLKSGRVVHVNLGGHGAVVGFASPNATRLFKLPAGRMASLNMTNDRKAVIQSVQGAADEAPHVFAKVPYGTTAVAFDELGNLCLCNPDLRAVTKVTTTFMIDCPHCDRPVRMIFSVNGKEKAEASSSSRSF